MQPSVRERRDSVDSAWLAESGLPSYACRVSTLRSFPTVWSLIQAAGWPIWPLIFASIVALALIFERLWSLRQSVVAPPGLVDRVLAEYRQGGPLNDLVAKVSQRGPLGRILAAALVNVRSPRPVMKEAIEEVGQVVTH